MRNSKGVIMGLILILVFTSGCNKPPKPQPDLNTTYRDFRVGVAPFPRKFPGSNAEDWKAMDRLLPEVAEVVNGQDGDWRHVIEDGKDDSLIGFAGYTQERHGTIGMFGINYVEAQQVHNEGTLEIDWSSEEDKQAYKNLALDICKTYDAEYLALAIENNFHYKYRPQDFGLWVEAYKEMYDTIKQECPNTKVFVTFQYEMTRGLGSRYWGEYEPQWEILDKFADKLDLVVFTSYPEIEYDTIDEIPDDYYSEIRKHTNKKIAFTELGWQNGEGAFISRFLNLTEDLDMEFVLWIFMHDTKLTENNPFPDVGLRRYDGTPKGAWFAWKKLKETPYKDE